MTKKSTFDGENISPFNREFFEGKEDFTCIGKGKLGGKAKGLVSIKETLSSHFRDGKFQDIVVDIPRLTVITTHYFDLFMEQNNLCDVVFSDVSDERIAHHFQRADIPADLIGDLRALIAKVHTPLAIRSSSLLEDNIHTPFAGVYKTKMIPNNQLDTDSRFRKLIEAIKFVYASTYFKQVKDYMKATGYKAEDEKMAVIIQEVVGLRHGDRFYPNLSGVARSYNYYPFGRAKPEDGIVNLALGLGKTIVDGGLVWSYSPSYPNVNFPYNSVDDLLKQTQIDFWAVNMGEPPAYNPIKETEYLVKLDLSDAEQDDTLSYIASTYDVQANRINIGVNSKGPRIITFAPILQVNQIPLNDLLKTLLKLCKDTVGSEVEIEFAMTFDPSGKNPTRFSLLQVRQMFISEEMVDINEDELNSDDAFIVSENVLGSSFTNDIQDIVYAKPETFDFRYTKKIADEIEKINQDLSEKGISYLLIGFGRWGTSDPWLGIPIKWAQISGAKIIVETTTQDRSIDLSQGSHFFHNISSLRINYFSLRHDDKCKIDWEWLALQKVVSETKFIRHIKLKLPLKVKVDRRKNLGVILK